MKRGIFFSVSFLVSEKRELPEIASPLRARGYPKQEIRNPLALGALDVKQHAPGLERCYFSLESGSKGVTRHLPKQPGQLSLAQPRLFFWRQRAPAQKAVLFCAARRLFFLGWFL